MKKFVPIFFAIAISVTSFGQGPYAPAAGQPGSTAIHKDSSIINSWATGIEIARGWVNISDTTFHYDGSNLATFGYPALALGEANGDSYNAVSLGDGGVATLTFNRTIVNGIGPDFAIFENSFSDTFLELAFVEVSSDGNRFVRFPAVSLTQTETQIDGFGTIDPTNIHNFAGKYRQGFGTPFDLDDLSDSTGIDLNNIRFVRIIDVVGSINEDYATYDSQGNMVNDPWPTPFSSSGFDLDAVAIINMGYELTNSNFDDLPLDEDSYWNGSDNAGGFISNTVFYKNSYDETYGTWSGFAYSNMRDDTTAGYTNQYSAITAGGIDAPAEGGTNYGVAFVPNDWASGTYDMLFTEAEFENPTVVSGFYVTNSTYAYLSMLNGDYMAKKFGGDTGDDPDYFKLLIWGERADETQTDTIEFFLADYRFADNSLDYIVDNWRWVDLLALGEVSRLRFSLESSDNGNYGMNTPAYFCIDNLMLLPSSAGNTLTLANPIADIEVESNAEPIAIDLSNVFIANNASDVQFTIISNSNPSVVNASLNGPVLTLAFAEDAIGEAELVVQAELNEQILTDTFTVKVISGSTSVPNTFTGGVKVYPNPFNTYLTIECEAGDYVEVYDLFGRKVYEVKASSSLVTLPTQHFSNGVYIVRLATKQKVHSVRVLKK